jgi:hypothetical protein
MFRHVGELNPDDRTILDGMMELMANRRQHKLET